MSDKERQYDEWLQPRSITGKLRRHILTHRNLVSVSLGNSVFIVRNNKRRCRTCNTQRFVLMENQQGQQRPMPCPDCASPHTALPDPKVTTVPVDTYFDIEDADA